MSRDSFLKRLPRGIHLQERLVLDALGFSLGCIALNIARLRKAALEIAVPPTAIDDAIRFGLFADAWSIVDQGHVVRSLLRTLPDISHPTLSSFVERHEAATLLRNRMDHLHANIPNLAKLTERRPPIHGALSFLRPKLSDSGAAKLSAGSMPCDPHDYTTSYIFMLTAGSFTHDHHTANIVNPAGRLIEYPVGAFMLHAFDEKVDLSELAHDAAKISKAFDNDIRPQVEELIRKHAAANGASAEELLEPKAAGLLTVLHIEFTN